MIRDDIIEAMRALCYEIAGNTSVEEAERDAAKWRDSPDLNEAWIHHLIVQAARLRDEMES